MIFCIDCFPSCTLINNTYVANKLRPHKRAHPTYLVDIIGVLKCRLVIPFVLMSLWKMGSMAASFNT